MEQVCEWSKQGTGSTPGMRGTQLDSLFKAYKVRLLYMVVTLFRHIESKRCKDTNKKKWLRNLIQTGKESCQAKNGVDRGQPRCCKFVCTCTQMEARTCTGRGLCLGMQQEHGEGVQEHEIIKYQFTSR